MRLGVSLSSAQPLAPDARRGAAWIVERARAAHQAGLDTLSLGDHHAMATPYYQNTPMLGRLLGEWTDRPAGCLFLVPLWHPVLMAEHIATLATLGPSPFIVQAAIGGGRDQFDAMGASLTERGARIDEGIAVVSALPAGETVDSERWGLRGASIRPLPPDPVEWWIGAGAPRALDRAARVGHAWYGDPGLTPASARPALATYLDRCRAHDRTPRRVVVRKDVIVTADGSTATRLGDELIAAGYRGLPRDAVAFGSPEAVAEQLAPFAALGFTDIVARTMTVDQAVAVETIELLGEVRSLLASG